MPRRSDTSDLTCALDANPVLDRDHVYFSDQGWAYRHFKNDAKTEYWDEILVAGQALLDNGTADNTADTFGAASVTFLTGDGVQSPDFTLAPASITIDAGTFVVSTTLSPNIGHDGETTLGSNATYAWSTDETGATFDDNTLSEPTMTHAATPGNYTLTCVITDADAVDSPLTVTFDYEVVAA